jgi:hypothetical protein
MMATTLDEQIVDAGGLIALLLVFVFAYFSALLPLFEDIRHRPMPAARDDITALKARISSYRSIAWCLCAVVVLVFAVLAPLSWHAVNSELWIPFQTLRVGLLTVDVLLLGTGAGILIEIVLLTKRLREL